MMGEYGTDPDEILSLIIAAALTNQGLLDLLAVVGNHAPALQRARQAKSTLSSVGLSDIPVGMGEAGFSASNTNHETDPRSLAPPTQIQRGRDMLRWTLEQSDDHSVALVLNSGFTDAIWLLLDHTDLFLQKVKSVVVMSGIVTEGGRPKLDEYGFMVPSLGKGGAANNCFDPGATRHLFDAMQRHGVPMTVTTRHAAYQVKLPFRLFTELAATGHPVGIKLNDSQTASINGLWQKVNAPAGSNLRDTLPTDRDATWFGSTFCNGVVPPISANDDVAPFIKWITLYDPLNTIAAIPSLVDRYFRPYILEAVSRRGQSGRPTVNHQIIGLTPQDHGIRDAHGLRALMNTHLVHSLRDSMTDQEASLNS
jgi:inosine-uridine nucleoside N-ribohydrolase